MTYGKAAAAAIMLAALVTGGCQTASLEDAAPTAAVQPASPAPVAQAASGTDANPPALTAGNLNVLSPIPLPGRAPDLPPTRDFVRQGVANTGTYPNVGEPRQAANQQLSATEQAIMRAELDAARAAQSGDTSAAALYQRRLVELRRIAATHAQEAQREIEN